MVLKANEDTMRHHLIKNFLILFFFNCLDRLRKKPDLPHQVKKIAIFSTTGLGDTLWSTPAIKALKTAYPDCHLTIITSAVGKEVLLHHPLIDQVIVHSLFSFWQLFRQLRLLHLDAILIFHSSQRKMFLLAKLLQPFYLISTSGRNKSLDPLISHLIKADPDEHEIHRRLKLLEPLNVPIPSNLSLDLFITDDEHLEADQFLKAQMILPTRPLIGIHPGSKDSYKRWPEADFVAVAQALKAKYACDILLTGTSDEAQMIYRMSRKIPGSIAIVGQVSLRVVMALMAKMRVFLTNDTGPMHIGYALKVPTVAIFSPTSPMRCGPLGAMNSFPLYKKRCCTPCLQRQCRDPFCLRQISQYEVLHTIDAIMSREEPGKK